MLYLVNELYLQFHLWGAKMNFLTAKLEQMELEGNSSHACST